MAKFLQEAVKHPGAATAAAKREGLSVAEWAQKHQHDPGVTGQRARFAITATKISKSHARRRKAVVSRLKSG